ncbi:MAG: ATP phosphoribosyltransferase [Beijerinckiaceae bacterium]
MTDGPLILAVPSKGRLQDNASAFFGRAGLKFVKPRGERDYRGVVSGIDDAEILFLSASEITQQLAQGAVHLGITGEDLVRENIADADSAVDLLSPLGFGHANVVVAVPHAWIDVRTMADLDDVSSDIHQRHGRRMRVATKYINLTRRYFAVHGVTDYQIVESHGATEGAPAAGTAELIVDITSTGATLASNGLRVLDDGVILRSEANLVASLRAPWGPRAQKAVRHILSRIAAAESARRRVEVRADWPSQRTGWQAVADVFQAHAPFGGPQTGVLSLMCPRDQGAGLAEALVAAGAGQASVTDVQYLFTAANPLIERLEGKLGLSRLAGGTSAG